MLSVLTDIDSLLTEEGLHFLKRIIGSPDISMSFILKGK